MRPSVVGVALKRRGARARAAASDVAHAGLGSDDGGACRKKGPGEEAEEDVLDKLDAQVSQQEADRKRRRDEAPDVGGEQAGILRF